jgi:hypothetical protein
MKAFTIKQKYKIGSQSSIFFTVIRSGISDSIRIKTGTADESRFHNKSFKRTGYYSSFYNFCGLRCAGL